VRDVYLNAGAGFMVVLSGEVMTMPGLPKAPASDAIDIDADGNIVGWPKTPSLSCVVQCAPDPGEAAPLSWVGALLGIGRSRPVMANPGNNYRRCNYCRQQLCSLHRIG
jgi:formate--tetrahydrofolate ligase